MIVFQNKGLIDVRALKTFGVSAKVSDSAIGYFGTGLKYALAILLREECHVVLYRGRKKYSFAVKPTKIRNDGFDIITMNGEELAFTTALGKDWELWQAFRELWCNTIDENGMVGEIQSRGEAGCTTITVEGDAFDEVYAQRDTVLLTAEPDLRLDGVEVHNKLSEYLYYRGIRVQKLRHPSIKTYNITKTMSLTEDRTVRYSWDALNILKRAIVQCTNVKFIEEILLAGEGSYEHKLDFEDLQQDPGGTFISTAHNVNGKKHANKSATRLAREAMRQDMEENHSTELTGEPAEQLEKAKQFCQDISMPLDGYTVIVVDALEDGDKYLQEGKKIFLTLDLFLDGTRALTEALIRCLISSDPVTLLIGRVVGLGERLTGDTL